MRQVQAEDNDWADNGRVEYSLTSVSNNGKAKFVIHPQTGVIDAVGALNRGEKYTLVLKVNVYNTIMNDRTELNWQLL